MTLPTMRGTLPSDLIVTEDVASSLDLSSLDLADLDDRGGAITLSLSTSTGGQLTLSAAAGGRNNRKRNWSDYADRDHSGSQRLS